MKHFSKDTKNVSKYKIETLISKKKSSAMGAGMNKTYSSKNLPIGLQKKKLIVFDLDGTLAESKADLKPDMSQALVALLETRKIAVIGGGKYDQFKNQLIGNFQCPKNLLSNFFLFPATATSFYCYRDGWKKIYSKTLPTSGRRKIFHAFEVAFEKINYNHPRELWGTVIEDRETQITFSALGQKAPLAAKEKWNKENDVRPKLMSVLQKILPEYEVRRGGLTSIDVTRKGIDKGYGIHQIEKRLKIPIKDMVFIGDALFPGGNDYAAKKTGVLCVAVNGPEETKQVIEKILGE